MAKKKEELTPEEKMEKNEKHNDGTMSGLTKTIIGTVGTIVTAAGAWAVSFFGSGKKEEKPQQQSININVPAQQQQPVSNTKTVIVKEKSSEKAAEPKPKPKKKEGDEFKDKTPQW
jgi:flagellar basal body-associated protein FliL